MAEEHLQRCSTSLVTREMQIETTLRFHLIPTRTAKINKTNDNSCCWCCGLRVILIHCWWECKSLQSLWKTVTVPPEMGIYVKIQLYYSWLYSQRTFYPTTGTLAQPDLLLLSDDGWACHWSMSIGECNDILEGPLHEFNSYLTLLELPRIWN